MVRAASEADMPQLLEWGRKFHAASPYSAQPFSEERIEVVVKNLFETGIVLVSETGMAAAMKGPVWFSDSEAAQEVFWWGDATLRQGLEDWARDQGCKSFSMVCLDNEKAPVMARLYRMQGYSPCEHHFIKAL